MTVSETISIEDRGNIERALKSLKAVFDDLASCKNLLHRKGKTSSNPKAVLGRSLNEELSKIQGILDDNEELSNENIAHMRNHLLNMAHQAEENKDLLKSKKWKKVVGTITLMGALAGGGYAYKKDQIDALIWGNEDTSGEIEEEDPEAKEVVEKDDKFDMYARSAKDQLTSRITGVLDDGKSSYTETIIVDDPGADSEIVTPGMDGRGGFDHTTYVITADDVHNVHTSNPRAFLDGYSDTSEEPDATADEAKTKKATDLESSKEEVVSRKEILAEVKSTRDDILKARQNLREATEADRKKIEVILGKIQKEVQDLKNSLSVVTTAEITRALKGVIANQEKLSDADIDALAQSLSTRLNINVTPQILSTMCVGGQLQPTLGVASHVGTR